MASQPSNTSCTIGGNTFDALEIMFALETTPDHAGMPLMGSLQTIIRVVVDISDTQNMPFGTLQSIFQSATPATAQSVQQCKVEYWTDDSKQNALCSVKFAGWISGFQTVNPAGTLSDVSNQGQVINQMLVIDLQPSLNQNNFPSFQFSN
ncbi:MAG TPA: hypothetical protein VMB25_16190 [Bryobacteraceae bacterium]|nr:hypothetical protein [Bryobacteraceae bacterium]